MGFPNSVLDTDERVVSHLHPHWKTLIAPVFWLLVVGALAGIGLSMVDNSVIQLVIGAVAGILLVWLTLKPLLTWMTTHFVFTTHRVMTRKGLLHREGRDVPLARINDVSFSHTIVERILGCGTLLVESAGERGQVVMRDVPQAEKVQSRLYRLVEEDQERRAALHHTPPAPQPMMPPPPVGQPGQQQNMGQPGMGGQQGMSQPGMGNSGMGQPPAGGQPGSGERPLPPGAGPYSEPPN